jgi:hypothetical protein
VRTLEGDVSACLTYANAEVINWHRPAAASSNSSSAWLPSR